MRATSGQYVSGGTITPPAPWIGSAMNAATRSGPRARIRSSTARAAASPNSSGLRSPPSLYQYGSITCSIPGIGSPPWRCMVFIPPRLAAPMVLPW